MWTLLVLSVIASLGVQGDERFQTTAEMMSTGAPGGGARCGSRFFGRQGAFMSPNYPNKYPPNSVCQWNIRPSSGRVVLSFSSVNVEPHPHCSYDAIYVHDGPHSHYDLLGKFCGRNSSTFQSSGTSLTVVFISNGRNEFSGFRADFHVVGGNSCRNSCGYNLGNCSCYSYCRSRGDCCPDFEDYCYLPTTQPATAQPSCRYNCGSHLGSCSCSSACQYYGNCCYDYSRYCSATTYRPPVTARPSCYNKCGWNMGSCSCSTSCEYRGNCCYDYYSTCLPTTHRPIRPTTPYPSCRYNCGRHMGSCSCSSSCQYNGNCCYDFYSYCQVTTDMPATVGSCGGSLFASGTLSSPNHPNHYYNGAYCVWQLRAVYDQRIILSFTYLELENCCSCDYIAIYDGPSTSSTYLGKVCNDNNNNNNNNSVFYSSSNYLTVVFRTDGSVVARGFKADFISSLPPSSGRVTCSDYMNIVIERSYLNSLGYDGHNLYLNDQYCRPHVSSYQVVFSYPINSCGNIRKFENGRVVYTNTLRAYTSSSGEITRQAHMKINVGCRMEQDSVAQIMYVVHRHDNSTITGIGRFNTSMDFYTSSNFYYKVTQVPYVVTLNQNLYVQVDLRRGDSSLVLFIDTCVTSPSPYDFQSRSYYLVRNGCAVDSTYRTYITGTRTYARFTFKAFQFLRATESVYIQCKVLICQASDNNSRCRRGCSNRVARDLGTGHDSETLVLGPIKLKDPENKEEETHKQDKA